MELRRALAVDILGISGSSRRGSYNSALLKTAAEVLPEGATLEVYDISPFPIFSQDLERIPPPSVVNFKSRLRKADAILFATPEHNFSISALLKNAIEWGNRPPEDNSWDGKPAAIVSAASALRGGARAQLHLRQIMVDLNMFPINEPAVLVARAREAFDSELRLTDERTRGALRELLVALVAWTKKVQGQ